MKPKQVKPQQKAKPQRKLKINKVIESSSSSEDSDSLSDIYSSDYKTDSLEKNKKNEEIKLLDDEGLDQIIGLDLDEEVKNMKSDGGNEFGTVTDNENSDSDSSSSSELESRK